MLPASSSIFESRVPMVAISASIVAFSSATSPGEMQMGVNKIGVFPWDILIFYILLCFYTYLTTFLVSN